jgi:hypothetical protein
LKENSVEDITDKTNLGTKAKMAPKNTASIGEEEENDDAKHPDYLATFQGNNGNSLRKKSKWAALSLSPPNPNFNYV